MKYGLVKKQSCTDMKPLSQKFWKISLPLLLDTTVWLFWKVIYPAHLQYHE